MACTDCKQSIFDDEPSKIPAPLCADNCPEDVNCNGEVLASACVYVNVALPCVDTTVNEDLTTVLQALDAKVCESNSGNCYVKIDADDCCGYLESKLTAGDGITITKDVVGRDCKDLTIALDCPIWNTVTLNSKWANYGGVHQPLEYSSVVGCVVKLRGSVKNTSYATSTRVLFTLPANHRPLKQRTFGAFGVSTNLGTTPAIGYFTIYTNGNVEFNFITGTVAAINILPVELTFETN